ncbi:MAG: glycosyltransferase family 2 protein [Anaerolineae bacterium]|nr:glycosyltransferase family 2 protein [Anaerolineae bacterium]
MYKEKSVAAVVPAYNEEKLIGRVIETMPDFVDWIVVVDDCSSDRTAQEVAGYCEQDAWGEKLILIRHGENRGVGGAIASGYKWCRDREVDVAAVMAGDAQMDPDDLPALLGCVRLRLVQRTWPVRHSSARVSGRTDFALARVPAELKSFKSGSFYVVPCSSLAEFDPGQ